MKKILVFIIILSINLFAQINSTNHWETIIYANDTWNYFIGGSEPESNWKTVGYDDSGWLQGPGGVGYGDGDDGTVISQTTSLYLRKTFYVSDVELLTSGMLSIDYDDGFIAFLNGNEIARAGISILNPTYNQTADTEHEANIPTGGIPDNFALDAALLESLLLPGENVLALQIHNASSNSTDLSSTTYLSVGITTETQIYGEIPSWFNPPFEFSSSNIPIVVINTNGGEIVHEPKIQAYMGIINNGAGNINLITDPFNEYDGWIGIEYRGNASFRHFDKKPFTIETRNEDGSNNNVKILDLPKENDFVLHSSQMDKTLLRDALAYNIYRKMGRWAPRTRHVELVLNGSYEGVYVLEEKIKPDKNRLDITKMDSLDVSGDSLTGGYIWCTNRRWGDEEHNDLILDTNETDGNQRFLRYPKPTEVMPEQVAYIKDLEQEFCDIMKTPYYNMPGVGYDKYINLDSFIDELIIQELTSNSDAYGYSGYFHKDRGGKINAGPEWDFDQGLCNSSYNDGARYDEWIVEKDISSQPPFWKVLFADPAVKDSLKRRWTSLRQGVISNQNIFAYVDSVTNYLNEAQEQNFTRWPILGVYIWRSLPGAEERDTYQKEVDYLKEWLVNHLQWMDEQLFIPTSVDGGKEEIINEFKLFQNYPNPFNPTTSITYYLSKSGLVNLEVYDVTGALVKNLISDNRQVGSNTIEWNGKNERDIYVPSGIYFYSLSITSGTTSWKQTRKMLLLK